MINNVNWSIVPLLPIILCASFMLLLNGKNASPANILSTIVQRDYDKIYKVGIIIKMGKIKFNKSF